LALLLLGFVGGWQGFDATFRAEYGARTIESIRFEDAPGSEELEGDPQRPTTVTIEGYGERYSFTGTQQEAKEWRERTIDELRADRELPAVRSMLSSFGRRLVLAGAVFVVIGLVLGVWWVVVGRRRRPSREDEAL